MFERVIPLADWRNVPAPVPYLPAALVPTSAPQGVLNDALGRALRDLRISVTDRCNFRCSYCMPKEVFDKNYTYLPHSAVLSFEEITRLARQFVAHGVQKIRLTGGEPLLRKKIECLIEQLATLRTPQGTAPAITLTTNGSLLERKAAALKAAGLQRVTISLDGLDDPVFRAMNDVDFPVAQVLRGIEAAQAVGLGPIKVNMVVKRGTNEHEILPMARHFKGTGVVLRFIEYMDVGSTNGWRMEQVMPSAQVLALIQSELPLLALEPSAPGETAQRWGYATPEGQHDRNAGEIGLISSVSQAFCGQCTRARLSTEGRVYLCLFASQGHDFKPLLRQPDSTDAQLAHAVATLWQGRSDRYSALRASLPPGGPAPSAQRVEMSYIGG